MRCSPILLTLTVVALAACSRATQTQPDVTFPAPTIYPSTQTPARITVTNTPEPTTASASAPTTASQYAGQWREIKPGIEVVQMQRQSNRREELVLLTRIDPRRATLRVFYAPNTPKSARDWQAETKADFIINGGFYDDKNRATGLVIADGQTFSKSYRGFGGMFSWRGVGPALQWLRDEPYVADPSIEQAVQGFPMLVINGARIEPMSDNGEPNRRTFVALDGQGRLLLGVTQLAQWSLTELAQFLDEAEDLNVVSALNLDGGASSGAWLANPYEGLSMNSFDPLPLVIAVYTRS